MSPRRRKLNSIQIHFLPFRILFKIIRSTREFRNNQRFKIWLKIFLWTSLKIFLSLILYCSGKDILTWAKKHQQYRSRIRWLTKHLIRKIFNSPHLEVKALNKKILEDSNKYWKCLMCHTKTNQSNGIRKLLRMFNHQQEHGTNINIQLWGCLRKGAISKSSIWRLFSLRFTINRVLISNTWLR